MDEPKRLTDKQEAFLDALMSEARGNIRAAMDIAGYSKSTKSSEVVGPLKDDIVERASMMLALNAPKAAFGIVDVLDDPSALGARNAISAAREVLDRSGIVKKEQVEVTTNQGGLFVLPPKSGDDLAE
jgi:hypothetical protein